MSALCGQELDALRTDKLLFNYYPKATNIPVHIALRNGEHIRFQNEDFVESYWDAYFAWRRSLVDKAKEEKKDDKED